MERVCGYGVHMSRGRRAHRLAAPVVPHCALVCQDLQIIKGRRKPTAFYNMIYRDGESAYIFGHLYMYPLWRKRAKMKNATEIYASFRKYSLR